MVRMPSSEDKPLHAARLWIQPHLRLSPPLFSFPPSQPVPSPPFPPSPPLTHPPTHTHIPRNRAVRATTNCTLWEIRVQDLERLMRHDPSISVHLSKAFLKVRGAMVNGFQGSLFPPSTGETAARRLLGRGLASGGEDLLPATTPPMGCLPVPVTCTHRSPAVPGAALEQGAPVRAGGAHLL